MSAARWYLTSAWRRIRYYWPAAQSRKRAEASLRQQYADLGYEWSPPWPWWWPFYRWPFPRKDIREASE